MIRQSFIVRASTVAFAAFFALLLIGFSSSSINAQTRRRARQERTTQRAAVTVARGESASFDPEIARIVSEIEARNIERTIRTLVSFGTRNTLSAQDDPKRVD